MALNGREVENWEIGKSVAIGRLKTGDARQCALVISGRMFGGGQRVVLDLADAASRVGDGVKVMLLGHETPQFDNVSPVVVEYDGRYDRLWNLATTAWRLRRALQSLGFHMIHTHGWDADIIGWIARAGLGMKQLVHLHVTPDWITSRTYKHQVRRWLTVRALNGTGTQIVAVSDAVRRHWVTGLGLDPDLVRVVRNGIDVIRYQPLRRRREISPPVIGVAARLVPMKGIEYLLDSLSVLMDDGMKFRLKIAGTGELRAALEERCERLEIRPHTEFLGHVDDMQSFYRTIDIYALPSVSMEGLPLGVLEAMASGVPVVATTVAGSPEAVRDGIDGLLVPPRDVCALANALRHLLADRETRYEMGVAGRNRAVEDFSLERFSGEVFELYKQILEDQVG